MSKWSKKCLVLGIFSIAILFSIYKLTESPGVWYDEGFYFQSAANLVEHGVAGMRFSPSEINRIPHMTVGYPLIYPLALWMNIFSVDIFSARSLMVIFILGLLIASLLFVRNKFGTNIAVASLALLATFPPLYGNGKSVLGEVPGMFYLILFLLCFNWARNHERKLFPYFLSGLFAGLCVVTKPIFIVLLPAILVGIVLEWKRDFMKIPDIVTAIVAGILPIVTWVLVQFQDGVSLGFLTAYYTNPSDVIDVSATILNNIRTLFSDTGTLFLLGVLFVWIVSFCVRISRQIQISSEEWISMMFSLLIVIAYTRTAGWYRYLFQAQIIGLIFLPHSINVLREMWFKRSKYLLPCITLILGALGAYQIMFSSFVAEAYKSDKTAFWQAYFHDLPATTTVFFHDVPEVAIFDRNTNYFQYLNPAGGDIGSDQLQALKEGMPEMIIAEDSNLHNTYVSYVPTEKVYKYTIYKKNE